jgi:hypothetical protein
MKGTLVADYGGDGQEPGGDGQEPIGVAREHHKLLEINRFDFEKKKKKKVAIIGLR